MAHIAIDCRLAHTYSGIGTFTRALIPELIRESTGDRFTLLLRKDSHEWLHSVRTLANVEILEVDIPHYSCKEQFTLPWILRAIGCDLLFSTHFNVPLFCPVPFVATIHDLILHRYAEGSSVHRLAYNVLMRSAVRRAKGIVTPSRFTAEDIAAHYGSIVSDKITVAHLGVSPQFVPASTEECRALCRHYDLPDKFLLYVGGTKQHKNVPVLVDAFRLAKPQGVDLVLATGGSPDIGRALRNNEHVLPAIADSELPALYTAATAMVTATLDEGFGLPLLEAMACGCPVLATRRASIPEIAEQGAAILVEPGPVTFAEGITRVLEVDRKALSVTSRSWAQRFTWNATAKKVSQALAQALVE